MRRFRSVLCILLTLILLALPGCSCSGDQTTMQTKPRETTRPTTRAPTTEATTVEVTTTEQTTTEATTTEVTTTEATTTEATTTEATTAAVDFSELLDEDRVEHSIHSYTFTLPESWKLEASVTLRQKYSCEYETGDLTHRGFIDIVAGPYEGDDAYETQTEDDRREGAEAIFNILNKDRIYEVLDRQQVEFLDGIGYVHVLRMKSDDNSYDDFPLYLLSTFTPEGTLTVMHFFTDYEANTDLFVALLKSFKIIEGDIIDLNERVNEGETETTEPEATEPEATEPQGAAPSSDARAALKKAQQYVDQMFFSKQRLYDQLTSEYGENFDAESAQYAIDNVEADWYANALQKAQDYSDDMHFSKARLFDQLTSEYGEQFTPEEAQYAVDNVQADFNYNALQKAQEYSDDMHFSKARLFNQLTSEYGEEFTPEEAQYAVDNVNANWFENALHKAKEYRDQQNMSRDRIYEQLVSPYGEEFTPEEAQYAIDNLP